MARKLSSMRMTSLEAFATVQKLRSLAREERRQQASRTTKKPPKKRES